MLTLDGQRQTGGCNKRDRDTSRSGARRNVYGKKQVESSFLRQALGVPGLWYKVQVCTLVHILNTKYGGRPVSKLPR